MKLVVVASFLTIALVSFLAPFRAQAPTPTVVDSPSVKVLTGLLAPQFQEEMNFITQALGVTATPATSAATSPAMRSPRS